MTWLAFLISVAYIPGVTGVAIATGWVAMSLVLPWVVWRRTRLTGLHWLGAAFLLYAFLSVAWVQRFDDAIFALWQLGAIAFAFILGSKIPLVRLWNGLAWGCGVSSLVALAQWLGGADWQPLATSDWGKPSGLFFNNAVAGAVAAIVITAQRGSVMWILALPLLILSQSRGAWAALIATASISLWINMRWRERLGLIIALSPFLVWAAFNFHTDTDQIRLVIWQSTLSRLDLWGHGPGSMMSAYGMVHGQMFHLEHAHNDYLTLAYQYGLGVAPLALLVGWLATRTDHVEWPTLITCLIFSLYFWPLEAPVPAFAFALVAGRMCADTGLAWDHSVRRRLGFLHWRATKPTLACATSGGSVPLRLEPED